MPLQINRTSVLPLLSHRRCRDVGPSCLDRSGERDRFVWPGLLGRECLGDDPSNVRNDLIAGCEWFVGPGVENRDEDRRIFRRQDDADVVAAAAVAVARLVTDPPAFRQAGAYQT